MDCEVCGTQNASNEILMDERRLIVCPDCSSLGEKVKENKPIQANKFKQSAGSSLSGFDDYSLVEGFGQIVRTARQQRQLSIKELAGKIFEKESFLHKIEIEKHIPDEKLTKKLEKFLRIKIIE